MKNEVGVEKERPGQYIDSESPFCRNCTRDDCPTNGDTVLARMVSIS